MKPSKLRRALLAATLGAAALPAAAHASTVEVTSDGTLSFRAGSGETNNVNILLSGGEVEVVDLIGVRPRGPACRTVTTTRVRCSPAVINIQRVNVQLGDRDDNFAIGLSHPTVVEGGDGDDSFTAGATPFIQRVEFRGGLNMDTVSYATADRPVRVSNDNVAGDGRIGFDQSNIGRDVERMVGTRFGDELSAFGSRYGGTMVGGPGDDVMRAAPAGPIPIDSSFDQGSRPDGADLMIGGSGVSAVDYSKRTQPVRVTLNHGGADDGEAGEGDQIIGSNEFVFGGAAGDTIIAPAGSRAEHTLIGNGGADTIHGADGPDALLGGAGTDTLLSFGGDDKIFANDGEADTVGCGAGSDAAELDTRDGFTACETRRVGVLKLKPGKLTAAPGEVVKVRLSWRHPRNWRNLRRIELLLTRDGAELGRVAVVPRAERLSASGRVKLVRRQSGLTHRGKKVTARLALRIDRALAGSTLEAQVHALDTRGGRQVVSKAGTIRVTTGKAGA